MSPRRILSLWFPRLAAERVLRTRPDLAAPGLAIVADLRGALVIASLCPAAEAAGLRRGMVLGDARAILPGLATRPEDPAREAGFLGALGRWAGRFSPWVAGEGREALALDVTGCAHLFGGEAGLAARIEADAGGLGLSVRLGIADTLGAAWAVARHGGTGWGGSWPVHAGDSIDQEARATRSRAGKRSWNRRVAPAATGGDRIVPPDGTLARLGPLPVAALRLAPVEVETLQALGLRRIVDLVSLPRAQLARRVGQGVLLRLDQALGQVAEPVAASRPPSVLAVRLTLPEPIALEADVLVGIDRLLPPLCARLSAAGCGARRVRLTLVRTDGRPELREVGLARPSDRPEAIRSLLALRLGEIDAGFGIERIGLAAVAVEPLVPEQREAAGEGRRGETQALADLIGRLAARLGTGAVIRLHPADSHIPEKCATEMAAAFSAPAGPWPSSATPRPILIFPPEPVTGEFWEESGEPGGEPGGMPPRRFVWRRRRHRRAAAFGPERIAPEWWLDHPAWRSGSRDYWRVETSEGERLWLFAVNGEEIAGRWFAEGVFA